MSFINKKLIRNLLIITGVFVVVFIILLIATNKKEDKKIEYTEIEKKLVDASKKYLEKLELLPKEVGDKVQVSSDVLISNNYIKEFDKMTSDTNCFGTVIVQKDGEKYNYMPYLTCDNYETKTFENEIISKLVEEDGEAGVYMINNEYIYRGEVVNNYIKLGSNMWRIIKLTDDGYLKLVKEKREEIRYIWDDRYNIEDKEDNGINDFEKSRIRDSLIKIYEGYDKNSNIKKYAVPREICVYRKSIDEAGFINNLECDEKIENSYLQLILPNDLVYGSLDSNCTNCKEQSCRNYNYFKDFFYSSWSTVADKDTTSKVYNYSLGSVSASRASSDKNIHLVMYINANNVIKDGDGSKNNPYQIQNM